MGRDDRPAWTDSERDQVKQMLRLDYTCSGIGRFFHPAMTRNAVIGRVVRDPELRACRPSLGESLRNKLRKFMNDRQAKLDTKKPKPTTTTTTSLIEPIKPRKARMPDPMLIARKMAEADVLIENPLPPLRVVPVHGMRMVTLHELERDECRWPVEERADVTGKFLFCGKLTKGGSYCEAHQYVAQPVVRRVEGHQQARLR